MTTLSERRRSVAFLEDGGETWACFLVTYPGPGGRWHGYFSFRPGDGEAARDQVRTADIFIEETEAEIHDKARGLGRPLLQGLLASARHTAARRSDGGPGLRRRFRELLGESADRSRPASVDAGDVAGLRSLYASYRLDQVAHLICLVEPEDLEAAVDRILEGERIDFRARDRIQFAMMVVEYIERRLPLPPFEVWVEDYLANPEAYRLYAHTLHREGRLP